MTVPEIIHHLEMVAGKEGITYEDEALNVIAEKADGGMRDALSIFDQVSSFCQGHITYDKVLQDLNVLDTDNYFKIIDLSLENKSADIMVLLDNIIQHGFDGSNVVNGLASHVRNVMMAKDEQTLPLLEVSEGQRQKYKEQAQKCPLPFLYKALRILNECDVQYRQSSNKRLLVELTLIRVAQITQPEDADVPAGGRSPMRLKSLFKKNNVVQPKPAMQVTGTARTLATHKTTKAATVKAEQKEEPTNVDNSVSESFKPQTASVGTLKSGVTFHLKNIGMTFDDLRRKPKANDMTEAVKVDEAEAQKVAESKPEAQFTDDDLIREWTAMCNRMPQKFVGLAARLKNLVPAITEYPNIEVVVDNKLLLDQINAISRNIRATMRMKLHNTLIEFTPRLAKQDENQRALTKLEVFDALRKKNPAIEKLRVGLGLELS